MVGSNASIHAYGEQSAEFCLTEGTHCINSLCRKIEYDVDKEVGTTDI